MTLDVFGFRALWSPYFLVAIVLIAIGYFLLTVKFRHLFKESESLSKTEGIYFGVAMVLLYIIKGSPLDLMGHIMFYTHMIQMAFLFLVIPPLLILAIPVWVWKKIWSYRLLYKLFTFFTKPMIALILFNAMFSFYHIPLIFDVIKTDMWLHAGYTSILFLFSIFMWWPLINKVESTRSLSGIKKVGYIFADGILLTPACALIIFNDQPMYATFSDPNMWAEALKLCVPSATLATLNLNGPEMFASMSLLHDQQLGGVLMKIIQEIVYGVVLAHVFFEWYKKDQQEAMQEQLSSFKPQSIE